MTATYVDLYWLPLGAGEATPLVRWSGRVFERLSAAHQQRSRCALFHSALEVCVEGHRFVIEMTPARGAAAHREGVVSTGPVGLRVLGRSSMFRYQVHRWERGRIDDVADAVDSPQRLSIDTERASRLLTMVPAFPVHTWGRDDLGTGEMWNSNSLTSWLLARSGHDLGPVHPPAGGRAPGWGAGLTIAARQHEATTGLGTRA